MNIDDLDFQEVLTPVGQVIFPPSNGSLNASVRKMCFQIILRDDLDYENTESFMVTLNQNTPGVRFNLSATEIFIMDQDG